MWNYLFTELGSSENLLTFKDCRHLSVGLILLLNLFSLNKINTQDLSQHFSILTITSTHLINRVIIEFEKNSINGFDKRDSSSFLLSSVVIVNSIRSKVSKEHSFLSLIVRRLPIILIVSRLGIKSFALKHCPISLTENLIFKL